MAPQAGSLHGGFIMKQQSLVQRLSEGIDAARRSAKFCVGGSLPQIDPGIEVADVGPLKLPLRPGGGE